MKHLLILVLLFVTFSATAQKNKYTNDDNDCVTYLTNDNCTNDLELQYILPYNENTKKFIEKGIESVEADIYIDGEFRAKKTLYQDNRDINIWRSNIGVKNYNNLKYKIKYTIVTNQKEGLRESSQIKYKAGVYTQNSKFKQGQSLTFKTSPNIKIPHGSFGIGSIGLLYNVKNEERALFDWYSFNGSLINTVLDFGIGFKLGFNLLEWSYYSFNKYYNLDSVTPIPYKGVHIISSPKIILQFDIRLYKHIPVLHRTFRPFHFSLSPYFAFKPIDMVVFDRLSNYKMRYLKSYEAGIDLHTSLLSLKFLYSYRANDEYSCGTHLINLKNTGSFSLGVFLNLLWYN